MTEHSIEVLIEVALAKKEGILYPRTEVIEPLRTPAVSRKTANFVHYIYRPFESPQKKYLMKERLPYDFGRGLVLYSYKILKNN